MGKSVALIVDEPIDGLGRALRDVRISLVDRCNYRCPYCMPESRYPRDHPFLAASARMSPAEIEQLVRVFVALGTHKVRLTGGEPLLRRDLAEIVARLAAVDGVDDLALTTNGALLAEQAATLRRAGLSRVTVSLDALDPPTFSRMSGGRGEVADVLRGIEAAEAAGYRSIKINTVVVRGANEHAPLELIEHFRGSGHVVRFIEYMDVGTCNGWRREDVVTGAELVAAIASRWPLEPVARAYRGEVAARYRFADGGGEIGFVNSISTPFCGDCSRARVSADGQLYTCLFAGAGHDLLGPLRAGADSEAIAVLVRKIWNARSDRYSEIRAGVAPGSDRKRIEMYTIGG